MFTWRLMGMVGCIGFLVCFTFVSGFLVDFMVDIIFSCVGAWWSDFGFSFYLGC